MSKISKEGYEQIQVIKNALDSMFDKLDTTVYTKNGTKYESRNVFGDVKDEFEAIAGIVSLVDTWEEVQ
tara:strand:- start:56 stop:262 length:207 start_codon:yes stop_codon:yes gene_type:complete